MTAHPDLGAWLESNGIEDIFHPSLTDFDPDDIVPQANDLGYVASVVDIINAGWDTDTGIAAGLGMDPRQGNYYRNAAMRLGLVQKSWEDQKLYWELTAAGQEFLTLDDEKRAVYLCEAIGELHEFNMYVFGGEEALIKEWGNALSRTTVERRLMSLQSWQNFIFEMTKNGQLGLLSRASTAVRQHLAGAERPSYRRRGASTKAKALVCPRCSLALPLVPVGECESCGFQIPHGFYD
jgi:hypothetical protein